MDPLIYARELASLGIIRINAGNHHAAEACLRRAVSIDPSQISYQLNLASTLLRVGKPEESISMVSEVLDKNQNIGGAWSILGLAQSAIGLFEESRDSFATSVLYNPENTAFHIDYSASLMLLGEWDEGWNEYEHRINIIDHRFVAQPFGGYPDDLKGKHILISSEQGAGDAIQFARFVPLIAEHASKVTFSVPASMYSLFQGYKEYGDISLKGYAVDGVDEEILLHSVPKLFDIMPDTLPSDPGLLTYAEMDKPQSRTGFNVGICWAGSTGHLRDSWRSILFEEFLPLANSPDWDLFSFQVGKHSAAIANAGAQALVTDLSGLIEAKWSAAATFLKSMDALVTCDTGVAHLAGALDIPVCLLIPAVPDWRWLVTTGDKSPWYPRMKIIRQERLYEWGDCIAKAYLWVDSIRKG